MTLIVINVLLFLLETWKGGSEDLEVALSFGAFYAPYVLYRGELWRLFTAMFLHFGAEHLGSNMLSLLILGSFMEQSLGSLRLLILYLGAGITGNLLVLLMDWTFQDWSVSAGASGAICGLMGVFLAFALLPRTRRIFPLRRVLFSCLLVLGPGLTDRSISLTAHIGGLLGGFLISVVMLLLPGKRAGCKL